jgi:hypothetical protein
MEQVYTPTAQKHCAALRGATRATDRTHTKPQDFLYWALELGADGPHLHPHLARVLIRKTDP